MAQFDQLITSLQKDVASISTTLNGLANDAQSKPSDFAYPDGISLLTLKNDLLLDYIHHLILLSAWKLSGRSLTAPEGSGLVKGLIKLRLTLEKVKPLENRLRYQMDKLLRAADDEDREIALGRKALDDSEGEQEDVDLLAFRPNPSAFMDDKARPDAKASKSKKSKHQSDDSDDEEGKTAVYRPPKLAPVAYDPDGPRRKADPSKGAARNSALLSDLTASLSSNPYEQSSRGVGVGGSVASQNSARARALQRMQDYEEENFTRLVMSKRDSNKRRRDEADVALGGAGLSSGRDGKRRIGGGVEEEFGDLLRMSSGQGKKGKRSEMAYDSLRSSARRPGTVQRSRESAAPRSKPGKTDKFKKQLSRRK